MYSVYIYIYYYIHIDSYSHCRKEHDVPKHQLFRNISKAKPWHYSLLFQVLVPRKGVPLNHPKWRCPWLYLHDGYIPLLSQPNLGEQLLLGQPRTKPSISIGPM
jgi:hypothetical protein